MKTNTPSFAPCGEFTQRRSATIGAAVVVVEYSILGYEVKRLADDWKATSGAEREQTVVIARALIGATSGMFLSFIAWLLGLPFLLLGLAIALGREYPRWLGWFPVVAAAGALISGTSRYLGYELVPFPVLYGGFIIPLSLWLALMGVLMWRRGATVSQVTERGA